MPPPKYEFDPENMVEGRWQWRWITMVSWRA